MKPTFDAFRESTMTSILQIGKAVGSWTPTLLIESPDGFHMVPIGEHATASAEDLGWVSAALANLQADRVARVAEARVLGEGSIVVVVLHVVEPGRAETWAASVTRDGPTLTLGEWKQQAFGGLVGESLQMTIDAVAARN